MGWCNVVFGEVGTALGYRVKPHDNMTEFAKQLLQKSPRILENLSNAVLQCKKYPKKIKKFCAVAHCLKSSGCLGVATQAVAKL